MWEFLKLLVSEKALPWIIIIVMISIWAARKGILSVKTNSIRLGSSDKERRIIRHQVEWIRAYCNSLFSVLPKPEGYDEWRILYIIERIYDEVISWITFNHLSTDEDYIAIKQSQLWYVVQGLTEREEYKNEEFHSYVNAEINNIIKTLVKIRNSYK